MCGAVRAGVMMAVSWTIGPLIGGPGLGRLKMNIRQSMGVIVVVHSIILFGYLTAMLLDCPEAQWAGTITQEGSAPALLWPSTRTHHSGQFLCHNRFFCGPGRTIGRIYARTTIFEVNDHWSRYLTWWYTSALSGSSSEIKVKVYDRRKQELSKCLVGRPWRSENRK